MDKLYDDETYNESEVQHYAQRSVISFEGTSRPIYLALFLQLNGPYRFFATLSFEYELPYAKAIEYGSLHARRVTKHAIGKHWKWRGLAPLTGMVVLERAKLFHRSTRKFGGYHFHYLIEDHPSLPRDDQAALKVMQDAFQKAAKRLVLKSLKRKGRKSKDVKLVTKANGTQVQLVYDLPGVCKYVSKEAWHWQWEWLDRVFYLGENGIQGYPEPKINTATNSITSPNAPSAAAELEVGSL
jgi:hypothetical protein